MSNNFKSIFDIFKDKMKIKNPYKEWIEREMRMNITTPGNRGGTIFDNSELFQKIMQSAQFASVKQAKQAKPAVVKLTPLEGVLKNSQGLNNKDLMQKQMKITRNMKESKPVVPVNNRQGNIHHEEKAKTADPKVIQRYKPLNNQIITLDL